MDLSANILMVFGAVGALLSFLSVSDSTTTNAMGLTQPIGTLFSPFKYTVIVVT